QVTAHYGAGPTRAFSSGALTRAAGETVAGSPYAITQGTLTVDSNYVVSFAPGTLTITKADTTTAITSDAPDASVAGQSVTVNFSVAVTAPGGGTPTGNVTVSDGTTSCTGTVGAGTCSLTFTTAGAHPLTATYAGDSNFNGSTSAAEPHTVN